MNRGRKRSIEDIKKGERKGGKDNDMRERKREAKLVMMSRTSGEKEGQWNGKTKRKTREEDRKKREEGKKKRKRKKERKKEIGRRKRRGV